MEIGGTKQQVALGTRDGVILERDSVKLAQTDAQSILHWLEEHISALVRGRAIAGCGVGFGGPLESKTGQVLASLQVPGWEHFPLRTWFQKRFSFPTLVANDTFTGGLGELHAGAGKGAKVLLYTNIGTGIGGGLYVDGKGFEGCGCGACYLGNTWVPDPEKAGAVTRMELICSGPSIAARLNRFGYVPADSLLRKHFSPLTAKELGEAAAAGDAFALQELALVANSFALALANALALTGADRVVIGGGVAKIGEPLLRLIRSNTDRLAFVANKNRYTILSSALMDDAVLIGGLLLAAGYGKGTDEPI